MIKPPGFINHGVNYIKAILDLTLKCPCGVIYINVLKSKTYYFHVIALVYFFVNLKISLFKMICNMLPSNKLLLFDQFGVICVRIQRGR